MRETDAVLGKRLLMRQRVLFRKLRRKIKKFEGSRPRGGRIFRSQLLSLGKSLLDAHVIGIDVCRRTNGDHAKLKSRRGNFIIGSETRDHDPIPAALRRDEGNALKSETAVRTVLRKPVESSGPFNSATMSTPFCSTIA